MFAGNINDVSRRDSSFRSTAALDLRCCVGAMTIASTPDPTPIVVQPIQVIDGQSVDLLCVWENINGQGEKEELLCRLQSCHCSIAFDLECWTDGLYPWTASQSKAYLLQNDEWAVLNSMHWPDSTAPLRAVLSHFAPTESEMGAGLAGCPRPL